MDRNKWFTPIDDYLPEKKSSKDELANYLAEHVYYDGLEAPADERVLFYNGIPIGSRGNIVAINGKAKSRKSVIASAIMSSAFCPGFLGFTTRLGPEPKVLNFDTEQGLGHWIEGSRRVIRDAGHYERPPGFHSHHTRDCEVETRIELLEYALDLYTPDIVVVDGVTDLVFDLNSQEEATRIGGKLMQWSVKYNCLIVTIIHITKGTGYMTGAVGTYLEKKCQTAIKCEKEEKDESFSTITCQYARDKGFPMFAITYDEAAEQYKRIDEDKLQAVGPKANNGPEGKSEAFKGQLLNAVFRLHSAYFPPRTIRGGIQAAAAEIGLGRNMQPRDVSAWLEYFQASQAIICHPETGWQRTEIIRAYQAAAPEMNFIERNPVEELPDADDLPF
jgi:hypothetical protein